MDWTTDAMLKTHYEKTTELRDNWLRGLTREERRKAQQEGLVRTLGVMPNRDYPLNAHVLDRKEFEDYVVERIAYSTMESTHVPVIVLMPKDTSSPGPAVLACHGHGNGQHDAVGWGPDGCELEQKGIHNQFAVSLVRLGMAVVIPEIMGFGVRRMSEEIKGNPDYSSCATLSAQLLMYGKTLAGMRIYEAMRAIDYLHTRPEIDSGRIGMYGFSGGGLIAAYTSALDERVKATVLSGWTNTFAGSLLAMHHCIDNYLPGLLTYAEQPDLAGLIAPRALFVESGEQDTIFPVEHVRYAISRIRETYPEWEADATFDWDIHQGSHQISGRKSFEWLRTRLTE